jgi:hypothetical protein
MFAKLSLQLLDQQLGGETNEALAPPFACSFWGIAFVSRNLQRAATLD